jgi:hypothetical protein
MATIVSRSPNPWYRGAPDTGGGGNATAARLGAAGSLALLWYGGGGGGGPSSARATSPCCSGSGGGGCFCITSATESVSCIPPSMPISAQAVGMLSSCRAAGADSNRLEAACSRGTRFSVRWPPRNRWVSGVHWDNPSHTGRATTDASRGAASQPATRTRERPLRALRASASAGWWIKDAAAPLLLLRSSALPPPEEEAERLMHPRLERLRRPRPKRRPRPRTGLSEGSPGGGTPPGHGGSGGGDGGWVVPRSPVEQALSPPAIAPSTCHAFCSVICGGGGGGGGAVRGGTWMQNPCGLGHGPALCFPQSGDAWMWMGRSRR